MTAQPKKLWCVLVTFVFAVDVAAQSDWVDKSSHRNGFVTANGVKLHYLDWGGNGDTMLLLHGFGDTAHVYDVLAPKFTNQFRVLALTRRGHGESGKPESGYDTATRVEDIRQFLDALHIPRAILVGHSLAGGEVTLFAGKHPDRIIKLVYLDAIYDPERRLELLPQIPPEFFPALEKSRRSIGWSDAWEASLRVSASADQEKRSQALGLIARPGVEAHGDYRGVQAPVLAFTVIGVPTNMLNYFETLPEPRRKVMNEFLSRYTETVVKECERFRTELPSARVVVLRNADHDCFIDREHDVVREMRTFLSR